MARLLRQAAFQPDEPLRSRQSGGFRGAFAQDAKSWFNHLLFNQDGSRFIFLHRWSAPTARGLHTRMFTASAEDGSDRFIIDPSGPTSHFVWRDPQSVFMFTRHPSAGDRFYVFKDKTREVEVIGRNAMTENGHNRFIPHTNNQWVLNDTYPDKNRLQHPYLSTSPLIATYRWDISFHRPLTRMNGAATTIRARAATANMWSSTRLTVAMAGRFTLLTFGV